MNSRFRTTAWTTAALAALSLAGAAQARDVRVTETDDGSVTARVRYSDLDLSSADGARDMVERIHRASMAVCGGEPADPYDHAGLDRYEACLDRTMGQAVARLDEPSVRAAYAASKGTRCLASAPPSARRLR